MQIYWGINPIEVHANKSTNQPTMHDLELQCKYVIHSGTQPKSIECNHLLLQQSGKQRTRGQRLSPIVPFQYLVPRKPNKDSVLFTRQIGIDAFVKFDEVWVKLMNRLAKLVL